MSKKFSKPSAILVDIEGTITDKRFVAKTLFPFIKKNLNQFLKDTFDTSETKDVIKNLREVQAETKYPGMPAIKEGNKDQTIQSVKDYILWQMDNKIRDSVLKQIELLCWLWGYEKGILKGHVYDDVSYAMHEWKTKHGCKIYTYSSAIIGAQQLLLVNTNHGNVYSLITECFDNTIGNKRESKSYKTIANTIGVNVSNILFITDSDKEANCATSAGLKVVLIRRSGNKSNSAEITSFSDIKF